MNRMVGAAAATLAAAAIVLGAAPAHAAQGGVDKGNKRAWVKVGNSEMASKGGFKACTSTGVSAIYCGHLGGSLDSQRKKNKKAKGYWAEFYYNSGKNKSGTW